MKTSLVVLLAAATAVVAERATLENTGIPAGLFSKCPGVMKNASISGKMLKELQVVIHQIGDSGIYRRRFTYTNAAKALAADKHIDLKGRRTVLYVAGFLDSTVFPQTRALATAYARRGYNVLLLETVRFTTYIYPRAVRISREVGKKAGELLVQLGALGLAAERLELVGSSLGAHVCAHAAKHFYHATGSKVARLTGLDPAGPCFRTMPPDERFSSTYAEKVDAVHTNIDGFGIALPVGHVDIYVNGGEFQPNDILEIPCLVLCSHTRAIIYWWIALEHPRVFMAMQCDSVQDARDANCYNGSHVINYMGLETNFDRTGVFYLATTHQFPYFSGKEGLKEENEVYTSNIRALNADDVLLV